MSGCQQILLNTAQLLRIHWPHRAAVVNELLHPKCVCPVTALGQGVCGGLREMNLFKEESLPSLHLMVCCSFFNFLPHL